MDGLDAMRGLNRALRDLSEARGQLQNRMTAALAFRAALAGKAHDFTAPSPDWQPEGVARAIRHELETGLECLNDLEASVEAARRMVARAEKAWLAERDAHQGRPRRGA